MGGVAVANLLTGAANPSGKLAQNWVRSVGQVMSGASPFLQWRVGKWAANTRGTPGMLLNICKSVCATLPSQHATLRPRQPVPFLSLCSLSRVVAIRIVFFFLEAKTRKVRCVMLASSDITPPAAMMRWFRCGWQILRQLPRRTFRSTVSFRVRHSICYRYRNETVDRASFPFAHSWVLLSCLLSLCT